MTDAHHIRRQLEGYDLLLLGLQQISSSLCHMTWPEADDDILQEELNKTRSERALSQSHLAVAISEYRAAIQNSLDSVKAVQAALQATRAENHQEKTR